MHQLRDLWRARHLTYWVVQGHKAICSSKVLTLRAQVCLQTLRAPIRFFHKLCIKPLQVKSVPYQFGMDTRAPFARGWNCWLCGSMNLRCRWNVEESNCFRAWQKVLNLGASPTLCRCRPFCLLRVTVQFWVQSTTSTFHTLKLLRQRRLTGFCLKVNDRSLKVLQLSSPPSSWLDRRWKLRWEKQFQTDCVVASFWDKLVWVIFNERCSCYVDQFFERLTKLLQCCEHWIVRRCLQKLKDPMQQLVTLQLLEMILARLRSTSTLRMTRTIQLAPHRRMRMETHLSTSRTRLTLKMRAWKSWRTIAPTEMWERRCRKDGMSVAMWSAPMILEKAVGNAVTKFPQVLAKGNQSFPKVPRCWSPMRMIWWAAHVVSTVMSLGIFPKTAPSSKTPSLGLQREPPYQGNSFWWLPRALKFSCILLADHQMERTTQFTGWWFFIQCNAVAMRHWLTQQPKRAS